MEDHGEPEPTTGIADRPSPEEGRLQLRYQPLRDPVTGERSGVEALARLRSDGRLASAPDFLDGLLGEGDGERLDGRVLELAAAQLADWPGGEGPAWVAVNVTPASLRSGALADRLEGVTRRPGPRASRFVLEVSERTGIGGLADPGSVLGELRDLGARVVLDDCGAGRASVEHVRDLPLDGMKVDLAELTAGGTGGARRDLAEGLVRLGKRHGLQVVIEGVATGARIAWAADAGADLVQGRAAGRPGPPGEV